LGKNEIQNMEIKNIMGGKKTKNNLKLIGKIRKTIIIKG
jgi:hypothetical protein